MAEIAGNSGGAGTQRIAPAGKPNPAPESVRERYWRFTRPLIWKFSAGAVLVLVLAAAGFYSAREYASYQQATVHTYQVRERIVMTLNDLRQAEIGARSYGLMGRNESAVDYYRAIAETMRDLDVLQELTTDNPRQAINVSRLRGLVAQRRTAYETIIADYRSRGPAVAHDEVLALVNGSAHPIRDLTGAMRAEETRLLVLRQEHRDRSAMYVGIAATFATLTVLALMLRAFFTITSEHRRRLRIERNLEQGAAELQSALGEARQLTETLRRLSQLGEMLQSCREPDEAIAVIERALPPLLPEMSGCLALTNPSHNLVEPGIQWGGRGADLAEAVYAPDDCWALRRSQAHPGFGEIAAPTCAHLVRSGVTAGHTLCLPLSAQGQVLGVLSLVAEQTFDAGSRELLQTVSDQLALAIANLRLQQSLRQQSIRDPLTGLFNRRYLEASLPRELARADRRKGQLALLMLDLDHFKRYNDRHGHDAGDALLAQFGATLTRLCRSEDIPCRYGGEEFTVVLVDIDAAQARERAEAIRAATSQIELRHRGQRLPAPSVSIGVGIYPLDGRTPEELKQVADQALYRAKREGRDRVMVHVALA
ncbi:MAG TPA: diguanylate cyclase [Rhodanobacteraceae bacterium]|nr:diguanylate cyclase [Rhodanobacteraceae bacterium]